MSRRYNPSHWLPFPKTTSSSPLTSAKNNSIPLFEQLTLHVTIGDLQVRSRFLIADTLAVYIPIEIEVINQHIFRVLSNKLKVIPQSLRPIAMLSSPSNTADNTVAIDSLDIIHMTAHDGNTKVAKKIQLKPRSVIPLVFSPLQKVFYGLNRTWL